MTRYTPEHFADDIDPQAEADRIINAGTTAGARDALDHVPAGRWLAAIILVLGVALAIFQATR